MPLAPDRVTCTIRRYLPGARPWQHLYGRRWQAARARFLCRKLCHDCTLEQSVTAADTVHHIVAHKGNASLFWDYGNWMPLCKRHHDIRTRRGE